MGQGGRYVRKKPGAKAERVEWTEPGAAPASPGTPDDRMGGPRGEGAGETAARPGKEGGK